MFQESTFLILAAVAGRPLHGYGIIKEVLNLSDEQLKLSAGTLYAALDRLLDAKLIALDREEEEQGRLRRYYRLTSGGRAKLTEEIENRQARLRAAKKRLLLVGGY